VDNFVKLIISLSISGGTMALVLLALKPLLRHRFSKSFQYYIWLIVLVRLAMPFTLEINLVNTLMNDTAETVTQIQQAPDAYVFVPENFVADTPAKTTVLPTETESSQPQTKMPVNYPFILWLAGMVVSLGWSLTSYFRFTHMLKRSHKPAKIEENALLKSLCGKRGITLYRNSLVRTPMLIGVFHPKIILPEVEYADEQLCNILSHELIHLQRFDIVIRWITTIVAAIHWFNPVVYFMRREINRACELSCDEAVIKTLDRDGKQSYGETLISVVAESRYPYGVISTTMCEEKKALKERLISIMKYRAKTRSVIIMSMALLVVLSAGALALGASITSKSNEPISAAAAMETLESSIEYSDSNMEISFQIPSNYPPEDWTIMVVGSQEIEGFGGMSTHIFDFMHHWTAGKRYIIPLRDQNYTGMMMIASLSDENGDIIEIYVDLLKYVTWSAVTRQTFSAQIPADLSGYEYREDSTDDFSLWDNDVKVGGMEQLNVDSLYSINHANLLSEEELLEFPVTVTAVKRLYERYYPAASGRTDTYEELRIGLLNNGIWYDFWLDLRYGREHDLMMLAKSVQFYADSAEQPMPGFTQDEIAAARAVVEEYFRARSTKDDDAFWKATTKQTKPDNTSFLKDVEVEITLLSIDFDPQDSTRETYVRNGRGGVTNTSIENVIVFRTKYKVEFTGENTSAWEEGQYTNWKFIVNRENEDSPWLIDDQGY